LRRHREPKFLSAREILKTFFILQNICQKKTWFGKRIGVNKVQKLKTFFIDAKFLLQKREHRASSGGPKAPGKWETPPAYPFF